MSQHVEYDEEWDVDEQTYILYQYIKTERTEDFGVDAERDETYENNVVDDVSQQTAYFEVEYIEAESEGAPNHDPEYYLNEIIEQNGSLHSEYDLNPEQDTFSVTAFNEDEIIVVHFRQFE